MIGSSWYTIVDKIVADNVDEADAAGGTTRSAESCPRLKLSELSPRMGTTTPSYRALLIRLKVPGANERPSLTSAFKFTVLLKSARDVNNDDVVVSVEVKLTEVDVFVAEMFATGVFMSVFVDV
jgi:hypothetical protein